MRTLAAALLALGVAAAVSVSFASEKPSPKKAGAKAAPACSALVFRPLSSSSSDGEQTAGSYKSRFARLELRDAVQNGAPVNYYLVANGNRLGPAPQVPQTANDCAVSKKMPRPGSAKDSCTGERFTAVLVHAADKRVVLLYALNGTTWAFCNAGSF